MSQGTAWYTNKMHQLYLTNWTQDLTTASNTKPLCEPVIWTWCLHTRMNPVGRLELFSKPPRGRRERRRRPPSTPSLPEGCSCWQAGSHWWEEPWTRAVCSSCLELCCKSQGPNQEGFHSVRDPEGNLNYDQAHTGNERLTIWNKNIQDKILIIYL